MQLVVRDADVLHQVEHRLARLLVHLRRVLHLPLAALVAQLQLEVGRVERERADVVHRRDALDLGLDLHEALQLGLVVGDGRVARGERAVLEVLVVLPQPVVLGERRQVLEHHVRRAVQRARQQQRDLDDLDVLAERREERLPLVLGHALLAPVPHLLRAAEHRDRRAVDRALHVVEARREPRRRHAQLHVDLEERALHEEEAAADARAHALLDRVERVARAVEQRLVRELVVVLAQVVQLAERHLADARVEREARDEQDEVLDRGLDLDVLRREHLGELADGLLLRRDELVERELLVVGHVHEDLARDDLEVLLDAVLDDVLALGDELLEPLQPDVHVQLVRVDVHARPCERDHARPQLELERLQVRLEQARGRRHDPARHALVLGERVLELVVVRLVLVLLQQHHLGGLGDLDADAREALGLADELQDLAVEVDEELARLRVADDERRLQPRLRRIDRLAPRLVPQELERDERARDLVVRLDDLLRLLRREHGRVALELAHRLLDALEQVARPHDVARDGRHVARGRRVVLELLVRLLHARELEPVVVEDDHELGVEVRAQVLAVQDALVLLEQREALLDARDALERAVDEVLQRRLELGDAHVELDVVAVELVRVVVEQVVPLRLELRDDLVENDEQRLHALELVLGERVELLHRREHVDQLDDAPAEQVELAEDLRLREVELLALGHRQQLVLREPVLLLVELVEPQARLERLEQRLGLALPQPVGLVLPVDRELAARDHLVRDFHEELRHALGRVVVARDRVDHLDRVHQRGDQVDHRLGVAR